MDVRNGNAVYMTFRLCKQIEYRDRVVPDAVGQVEILYDMRDMLRSAVMVMLVMVFMLMLVVFVFLLAVHMHVHMRTLDAAFDGRFERKSHVGDADVIELTHHLLRLVEQFAQGRGEHVARSAHLTVKKKRFHFFASI